MNGSIGAALSFGTFPPQYAQMTGARMGSRAVAAVNVVRNAA